MGDVFFCWVEHVFDITWKGLVCLHACVMEFSLPCVELDLFCMIRLVRGENLPALMFGFLYGPRFCLAYF